MGIELSVLYVNLGDVSSKRNMKFESASERSIFSTIRIETRVSSEDSFIAGTAFVYEFNTEENTYPFLVTVRHLIENAVEGRLTLMQGRNSDSILGKAYTLDIENFKKLWFCHPDDSLNIAVTPFVPFVRHVENAGIDIFYEAYNHTTVYDRQEYKSLNMGEEVLYLGYPDNCWDEKYLLPVFRQGVLSLPFWMNYQGRAQGLVDTPLIAGSSGSPVFVKSKFNNLGIEGSLLGVLSKISPVNTLPLPTENEVFSPMGTIIKMNVALEAITAYLQDKGFI